MPLLQVRVTLEDVEPTVWRLLEIDGARTLDEVHDAVQIAMGWTDSHLHVFEHPDGRRWASSSVEEDLADGDETATSLAEAVSGGPLSYEYDFGDSWTHRLAVVGEREAEEASVVLLDGGRSAPPEDCGGPQGYEHLLQTLADEGSDDHALAVEWLARTRHPWSAARRFDPEALDLERVNRRLAERFAPSGVHPGWGSELTVLSRLVSAGSRTALGERLEDAELDQAVDLDDGDTATSVRSFTWFLDRVGSSLALTSAGRLPPAVVREASQALGWDQRWVGAMNREDHVRPAVLLRETAVRTVLVRKYRGTLLPTRAGLAARRDPDLLLRHLATFALRPSRSGPERTAGLLLLVELACGAPPERDALAETVAFGLSVCGYAGEDGWTPPSPSTALALFTPTWDLLGSLGLVEDAVRDVVPSSRALLRNFARLAL